MPAFRSAYGAVNRFPRFRLVGSLLDELPRRSATLVQVDDRRLPRGQSFPLSAVRRLHRRLGAGPAVHLHAGHGAQVLPASARGTACHRSACAWHDLAGARLPRGRRQPEGDPAPCLHGGGHLLHEGTPAVHLHEAPGTHPEQDAVVGLVLLCRCGPVGVSRCAYGDRGGHQRRRRVLRRLPPNRLRRRPPRRRCPGAASRRPRAVPRLSAQPRHARGGGDGLGRRYHHRRRAPEHPDRRQDGMVVHGVLLPHGARHDARTRRGARHLPVAGTAQVVRVRGHHPPGRVGGTPGIRSWRNPRNAPGRRQLAWSCRQSQRCS